MKLYFHPASANCRKVQVAALLLDIPLEYELVDLMAGQHQQPAYLAINPNGMVPALRDGSFVLWESNAILQYLAGRRPGSPLWPEDARLRADVVRWQCWELAHWSPAVEVFLWENIFKQWLGLGQADPAELREGEKKLRRFGTVLNDHLDQHPYLVGEQLTLADLSVAAYLMYGDAAKLPLDNFPAICRWFERIEALPEWQQTTPKLR